MKASFLVLMVFALVGCSGSKQSVKSPHNVVVKSATVQKMVPGIEQGEITFVFLLDFEVSDSYKAESIKYNSHSTNLFLIGKNGFYKGQVAFTQEELTKLTSDGFIIDEAIINFSNGMEQFQYNLNKIKVLEDNYMP